MYCINCSRGLLLSRKIKKGMSGVSMMLRRHRKMIRNMIGHCSGVVRRIRLIRLLVIRVTSVYEYNRTAQARLTAVSARTVRSSTEVLAIRLRYIATYSIR